MIEFILEEIRLAAEKLDDGQPAVPRAGPRSGQRRLARPASLPSLSASWRTAAAPDRSVQSASQAEPRRGGRLGAPPLDRSVQSAFPSEPSGHRGPRRGVAFLWLRDRFSGEGTVGSVTAPPLDELAEETHWLSGAPVVSAPAVLVACSPRLSRTRFLDALEKDTGGDFTRSYALQGFGDSHGSVERCLWVVDPDKGGFNDLRAIAAAATCVKKRVRLDVAVDETCHLDRWLELVDGLIPSLANHDGLEDKERARLLARAEAEERPVRAMVRASVLREHLVRACRADDGPAVRVALELGADPKTAAQCGLNAEVAARPGGEAEKVLEEWFREKHGHADFIEAMETYLKDLQEDPPEVWPDDASPDECFYETEHVEVSATMPEEFRVGADEEDLSSRTPWMERLLRKYPG